MAQTWAFVWGIFSLVQKVCLNWISHPLQQWSNAIWIVNPRKPRFIQFKCQLPMRNKSRVQFSWDSLNAVVIASALSLNYITLYSPQDSGISFFFAGSDKGEHDTIVEKIYLFSILRYFVKLMAEIQWSFILEICGYNRITKIKHRIFFGKKCGPLRKNGHCANCVWIDFVPKMSVSSQLHHCHHMASTALQESMVPAQAILACLQYARIRPCYHSRPRIQHLLNGGVVKRKHKDVELCIDVDRRGRGSRNFLTWGFR